MSLVIFLGDVTSEIADVAKSFDSTAYLIDHSNVKQLLENPLQATTVYTSLGDLPEDTNLLFQLFDLATEIKYCPPADNKWSDRKNLDPFNIFDSMQGTTEYWLSTYNKYKRDVTSAKFTGSFDSVSEVKDQRKSDGPQLWNVGCSYTSAIGVENHQRYGELLANDLNLPVSFLAKPGGSIDWCADQILRSDIRPGDLVVWGLTAERRFSFWHDNQSNAYTISHRERTYTHPILSPKLIDQILMDDNIVYQGVNYVNQVINFCRKLKIKLLIMGIIESAEVDMAFVDCPEFVKYINFESPTTHTVDLGTDNSHPGPLQHQLYATFCKSFLKKLNYI